MEKLGYLKPRKSEEIEGSPWGVCFNTRNEFVEEMLDSVAQLGVKWARVEAKWFQVESKRGRYEWSSLDQIIDGLIKRRIQPFVCVTGGNPNYTKGPSYPPIVDSYAMEAWLTYVRELVSRYQYLTHFWEIWNEPNYGSFWKPEPNPDAYVQLVKETSETIRRINTEAVILAGSLARVDLPFAEVLFARGIARYIDKFVYHPYNAYPEACAETILYPVLTPAYYLPSSNQVSELDGLLRGQERHIALWQGECGYPSAEHSIGWKGTGPWGECIQAKWLLRRLLVDVSLGAEVATYYALLEYGAKQHVNSKGLLRLGSRQPKPAYYAFQNLTSLIDNNLKLEEMTLKFEIRDHGIFYGAREDRIQVVCFANQYGEKVLTYWLPWRAQEIIKPAKVNIFVGGENRDELVLVNLVDGVVYRIDRTAQDGESLSMFELPLTDYPMAIASPGLIEVDSTKKSSKVLPR